MQYLQLNVRGLAWLGLGLVLGLLPALGCGPTSGSSRGDEDHNPYYQRAKRAMEARDYKDAVALYKQALLVNPQLAAAHLEVGLLYDDKLGDPVAAIYHYRQYLELKPDSTKRSVVEDFIERSKLALASKLPQSPIGEPGEMVRLQTENAALVQKNAMLQAKLIELEQQLAQTAARTPTAPVVASAPPPPSVSRVVTPTPVAPPPPSPAPVAPPPVVVPAPPPEPVADPRRGRLHVVEKGDTLQSLALRYYGTRSAWDKIYQANRDQLPSRDDLKIGQRLLIP